MHTIEREVAAVGLRGPVFGYTQGILPKEVHTYLESLVPPSPHRVQQYWKPNLGAIFNGLVHPAESTNGPLPLRACTIVKTPSA